MATLSLCTDAADLKYGKSIRNVCLMKCDFLRQLSIIYIKIVPDVVVLSGVVLELVLPLRASWVEEG